jgi:hypothetical protein
LILAAGRRVPDDVEKLFRLERLTRKSKAPSFIAWTAVSTDAFVAMITKIVV